MAEVEGLSSLLQFAKKLIMQQSTIKRSVRAVPRLSRWGLPSQPLRRSLTMWHPPKFQNEKFVSLQLANSYHAYAHASSSWITRGDHLRGQI